MDQGSMHNSGIDIPKRKDKEDLTESSEVVKHCILAVIFMFRLFKINLFIFFGFFFTDIKVNI